MRKKKYFKLLILVFSIILSNVLIFSFCNLKSGYLKLSYTIIENNEDVYQVFYTNNNLWSEDNSQKEEYLDVNCEKVLTFEIPQDTKKLRFDLGSKQAEIIMKNLSVSYYGKKIDLQMDKLLDKNNMNQIANVSQLNNTLSIQAIGTDPYIVYEIDNDVIDSLLQNSYLVNDALKLLLCILTDALIFIVFKKSKSVFVLVNELNANKLLIWSLSKNDFKTKYAGSYLGIIWAFIQPIITIVVYWIVFQFGLKAGSPIEGIPFVIWFTAGLIPWFFFSEALMNATTCMMEYSYLVKKVVFKISILPIVKIMSSLFVHLVFVSFIILLYLIYGFYPTIYLIQLIYYSFCIFFLSLAISYITASIIVFFKDLSQIITIILQIGMWMTPIMWSYTIVPEKYQWIVKLNPMYYVVEGYRDTFIKHIWFWNRYYQTVYFWIISLAMFAIGALIFKKLKAHFADVL
jgi:ABC-type polysaccharide/polyol phosphate export systems, permease component